MKRHPNGGSEKYGAPVPTMKPFAWAGEAVKFSGRRTCSCSRKGRPWPAKSGMSEIDIATQVRLAE